MTYYQNIIDLANIEGFLEKANKLGNVMIHFMIPYGDTKVIIIFT